MIRIGCVPDLNSRPLIEGLEGVLLRPPARLVEILAAGKLDVALVSAIEVRRRGWAFVPGIAVASPGKTDSVRLHHKVRIRDIRRVALDSNSRTSNVLARILLEKRYGVRPAYIFRNPAGGVDFRGFDAAVTIGDTSFRPLGVPSLDLGAEWRAFTGKPFVYALWAHRPRHPHRREIVSTLKKAKAAGVKRIPEIARTEAKRLGLSPRYCRMYMTKCLTYDLGPAERAGLRLFERYAAECTGRR